jgi:type VI secretion system protein ImpG
MDPRLLRYYNRELQHIREMGAEFAEEFPKIAGRLGIDGIECSDPYVERLLEGFAFLAARVQMKIDSEFPGFTQHLLEIVYPHYLSPTPSMTVVRFEPDRGEGGLGAGFRIPRGAVLRSVLGKGEQTPCEYRTGHEVTLWPVELVEARYFSYAGDSLGGDPPGLQRARAAIRLRLRATAGLTFDKIEMDRLVLHLTGRQDLAVGLYERMISAGVAVVVAPTERPTPWQEAVTEDAVGQVGFERDEGLLPYDHRTFSGYRMLHEYFAFPPRFLFLELRGLARGLQRCASEEVDVHVLLDRSESALESEVDRECFDLFCAPAINLFPRKADRIHLEQGKSEYHVVPDRTRPLDFEVHSIQRVTGYGASTEAAEEFLPFYGLDDDRARSGHQAYFTVRREPRVLSARQRRSGHRTGHVGSEVFLALADADQSPYGGSLRQLAVETLCTNRDLPLQLSPGTGVTDFSMESSAPVQAVRCVAGPTKPGAAWPQGESTWRIVGHLALNYLSLLDGDGHGNAAVLRQLLSLYGDISQASVRKQVDGVRAVEARPVTRRLPTSGPLAWARGTEITVSLDDPSFEGSGIFLLGAVLDRFFARYASINSFTETVIRSTERGEVMRWPIRAGNRQIL